MMSRLALAAFLLIACGVQQAEAAHYCTGYSSTLSFGSYNPGIGASFTTTVHVTCDSGNVFHIGLNAGTASGGTTTTRIMHSGTNPLNYKLFQDPAHSINWGNNPPSDTVNGTGNGSDQVFTVYGTVPEGQFVTPAANYVDTITTTVTKHATPSTTFQFGVNATVAAGCSVSATDLNFGNYSGLLINATSTVTVSCTNTTPYYVNLGNGLHASDFYPQLYGNGSYLSYRLYQDAAWSKEWRNTYNFDGESGTGNGLVQSLTVYGQMPAAAAGNPGPYTDTIIVTVTY